MLQRPLHSQELGLLCQDCEPGCVGRVRLNRGMGGDTALYYFSVCLVSPSLLLQFLLFVSLATTPLSPSYFSLSPFPSYSTVTLLPESTPTPLSLTPGPSHTTIWRRCALLKKTAQTEQTQWPATTARRTGRKKTVDSGWGGGI